MKRTHTYSWFSWFLRTIQWTTPLVAFAFLYASEIRAENIHEVSDPSLMIGTKRFLRSQLLNRPDLETIRIKKDPNYGDKPMDYTYAVRVASLFSDMTLAPDDVLQFRCFDDYAAAISKDRLITTPEMADNVASAYIAIENPQEPWPPLTEHPEKGSAGPFYLIWVNTERSGISPFEWVYQVAGLEPKGKMQSSYPLIYPSAKQLKNRNVAHGFDVFQKTCFACHTMNGQGFGSLGPDLNIPQNPVEYFKPKALVQLIRDPSSVRKLPEGKMPSIPRTMVSDRELRDLVEYFKAMVKMRPNSTTSK